MLIDFAVRSFRSMKEGQKLSLVANENGVYRDATVIEGVDSRYKGLALPKSRVRLLYKGWSKSNLINALTMKGIALFYYNKHDLNTIKKVK